MTAPVVQPRLAHAACFRPQQEQQAQAYLPRCAGTCLLPEISPWKNYSHAHCLLRTRQRNKSYILLRACCSPGHQITPCRRGLLSMFLSRSVPSQRSRDVADAPAPTLHCFDCFRGRRLPCPFLPFHSSARGHKGSSCSLTGGEHGWSCKSLLQKKAWNPSAVRSSCSAPHLHTETHKIGDPPTWISNIKVDPKSSHRRARPFLQRLRKNIQPCFPPAFLWYTRMTSLC